MVGIIYIAITIISLILNLFIFIYFYNKLNKVSKLLSDSNDTRAEYENMLLKALNQEYDTLSDEFDKQYQTFKEDVNGVLESAKSEKQKLSIEEAILLLQKQDNNWFDKHFTANQPTTQVIEDVFSKKYEQKEERYTQFIDEIRKESEL